MWLPKPIYEALPTIYMAIGIMFLGGAIYLGAAHEAAPAYGGIGLVCLLSGIFVRAKRYEARSGGNNTATDDSDRA